MDPYQIVLADDHAMLRRGVKRIIEEMDGVKVIGEAADGLELLELLKRLTPDLVIVDISMPNVRGIEAAREIKVIHPKTKVLILTMHKDREYLYHAMAAGADGYLLKENADSDLVQAIKTIRQGKSYLSPLISDQVHDLLVKESRGVGAAAILDPLSSRERQILKLVAEVKSSQEIADLFFISLRTVQHHRANMMRKLNLKKSADLIKYALQKGYA